MQWANLATRSKMWQQNRNHLPEDSGHFNVKLTGLRDWFNSNIAKEDRSCTQVQGYWRKAWCAIKEDKS